MSTGRRRAGTRHPAVKPDAVQTSPPEGLAKAPEGTGSVRAAGERRATGSAGGPSAAATGVPFTPDPGAPALPMPTERPLKVYAFDPSSGRLLGNQMTVTLRYEPLKPGPVGEELAVIDYDGTNKTYYTPVDLDDPRLLIRGGLDPTESDPRFHQQMVYAVASETLQRFESALGRRVHWRRADRAPDAAHKFLPGDILRLNLFPHAMEEANAFYSPDAHGILFGYFRASTTEPGRNLPGQRSFTCLSHDIIAHEMTHAIIDGTRTYFTESTNIDVAAFHEGFADLVALFRHFSHQEALLDTLQKTGGRLFQFQLAPEAAGGSKDPVIQAQLAAQNPLIQLAQQFGEAAGMRGGLRNALSTPVNATDYRVKTEPHDRGAILVAAVFDAYFTIYTRRTADLFRIFRAGGGAANPVDLPGPLAERLAAEASHTAREFFLICARALDYCPPVDITFGDFLRAVITAGRDLQPADPDGVRDAFMQAFRLRGIVAESASFFSEDSLSWPSVPPGTLPPVQGLAFGDPNGLTLVEKNINGNVLRAYAQANAVKLGFDPGNGFIQAPSFHPLFRLDSGGGLRIDMVAELLQTRQVEFDAAAPGLGAFPMRGGVTLLISQQPLQRNGMRPDPEIRYVIAKHLTEERVNRQREYCAASGLAEGQVTRMDELQSSGSPRQQCTLRDAPLPFLEGYPIVTADDGTYQAVRDLQKSGPDDRVFQLDDAGKGGATITFGDGLHGKIPVGKIVVTTRSGDANQFKINFALIHGGI